MNMSMQEFRNVLLNIVFLILFFVCNGVLVLFLSAVVSYLLALTILPVLDGVSVYQVTMWQLPIVTLAVVLAIWNGKNKK